MLGEYPDWKVEKARSGDFTVSINGMAIHSRFNPVREARKIVDTIPAGVGIVVLAGFGLGYVAEAIIESAPKRPLVIAEADAGLLMRAAETRNLESLLNRPEVSLLIGGDPQHVCSLLAKGPPGTPIYFIPWHPAMRSNPKWYETLRKAVNITAQRRSVNARTLNRFGNIWVRNLAANRTVLPHAISIDSVKDVFENIPALVLAGGPTLDRALPHMKELSERFLLIVVDTALRGVLRMGVIPDIIAAVDPQYWNSRHLDWCGNAMGKSITLAESATHPAVFRILKGRCIMTRTRFPLGTVLEDAVGLSGELDAGGSVATAAWALAQHFGCSPIIAAGLDLGFPGRRTHYRGSLASERPHTRSTRISPSQDAFFHALHDADLYLARDANNQPILTDQRMDIYHAWFAEHILESALGATGMLGGRSRNIEGMIQMDLDSLLSLEVHRETINHGMENLRSMTNRPLSRQDIDRAIFELVLGLEQLEKLADKGMKAAMDAEEKIAAGQNADRMLSIMTEVDESLLAGGRLDVVSFLLQPLIHELTTSTGINNIHPLKNSQRLYKEISGSASYHLRYLR